MIDSVCIPYPCCSIFLSQQKVIGHGSFGVVLKGQYGVLTVALKMTRLEKYHRWHNEKNILMENNDHPNVVKLIDYGVKAVCDVERY